MAQTTAPHLLFALALSTLGTSALAQSKVVFLETFGSSTTRVTSPNVPENTSGIAANNNKYYQFADRNSTVGAQQSILDGYYAVINPNQIYVPPKTTEDKVPGDWWKRGTRWVDLPVDANGKLVDPVSGTVVTRPVYAESVPFGQTTPPFWRQWYPSEYTDADGNPNGAVMVVNAGGVSNDMYRTAVALAAGKTYRLSAMVFYVQSPGEVAMRLLPADGVDSTAELAEGPHFILPQTGLPGVFTPGGGTAKTWSQVNPLVFTVPQSCPSTPQNYAIALANRQTVNQGNDLFVDNIKLEEITDTTGAVSVPCAPAAPVAIAAPADDSTTTPMGTPVTIDVKSNDTVVDGNGNTITNVVLTNPVIQSNPKGGTVSVDPTTGKVTYTPNNGWSGTDTFTYQVCTVRVTPYVNTSCKNATVTVTVPGPGTNGGAATAVPLNNPVALLLAGLGIFGFAVSRSKRAREA